MNNYGNDVTTMMIYKAHYQELVEQADNERLVKEARRNPVQVLRRKIRINNDSNR